MNFSLDDEPYFTMRKYIFMLSKIGLPNYITARQIALKATGSLPTTFDALNSTTSPEVCIFENF